MIHRIPLLIICASLIVLSLGCGNGSDSTPEAWSVDKSTEFGRVPRWSPDGSMIAFGDDRPEQAGIWLWDTNSAPTRIANTPPHNWDYVWSPDGKKIAFSSPADAEDSLGGIWIANLETDEVTRVYRTGRDVSWGESGTKLFFQIENPVDGMPGIYSLTPGDTTITPIASFCSKPAGRPGSNQVAFTDGLIDSRLFVGGEGIEPVAVSGAGALQWDWSGNGRYLYFVVNRYTSGVIKGFLWRVDGDDLTKVDSLIVWASYPSVNQSGTQAVFSRSSGSTWLGIWIWREDGDAQISSNGEYPDIHPTQEKVAYSTAGGGIRILNRTS